MEIERHLSVTLHSLFFSSFVDRSILIDLDLIHSFNTMVFARSLVRPRPRKLCPVNSSIFSSIVGSSSAYPSVILHDDDDDDDDQHLSYLVTICLYGHLRLSTIPRRSDKFHLVSNSVVRWDLLLSDHQSPPRVSSRSSEISEENLDDRSFSSTETFFQSARHQCVHGSIVQHPQDFCQPKRFIIWIRNKFPSSSTNSKMSCIDQRNISERNSSSFSSYPTRNNLPSRWIAMRTMPFSRTEMGQCDLLEQRWTEWSRSSAGTISGSFRSTVAHRQSRTLARSSHDGEFSKWSTEIHQSVDLLEPCQRTTDHK